MTVAQLAERLTALEKSVEELKAQVARSTESRGRWWRESAGWFANDPVFEEIVRLGSEYRESLRPGRKKVKRGRS
jgi:hypothetical protein